MPEYTIGSNTLKVEVPNLSKMKYKNSVYSGGYYAKELSEQGGKILAELTEDEVLLIDYRNEVQALESRWESTMTELIANYLKLSYLVSRGAIYLPYTEPYNYLYDRKTHRIKAVARKSEPLDSVDGEYLNYVLKMVAFLVSDVHPDDFSDSSVKEIFDTMDKRQRELYLEYISCGSYLELIRYALSETEKEMLNEYVTVTGGKRPIDRRPTINTERVQKHLLGASAVQVEDVYDKEDAEELDLHGKKVNYKDGKAVVTSKIKKKNRKSMRRNKRKQDKDVTEVNSVKEMLAIQEDKHDFAAGNYKHKDYFLLNIFMMILGLGGLFGVMYFIAYIFLGGV